MSDQSSPFPSREIEIERNIAYEGNGNSVILQTTKDTVNNLSSISIEIVLRLRNFTDYDDDAMAIALAPLQPGGKMDQTSISSCKITIAGCTVLTQQTFLAVAPIARLDDENLTYMHSPFISLGQSVRNAPNVNTLFGSEKAVIKALFGIHGVSQVEIDGPIDSTLRRKLFQSLTARSGPFILHSILATNKWIFGKEEVTNFTQNKEKNTIQPTQYIKEESPSPEAAAPQALMYEPGFGVASSDLHFDDLICIRRPTQDKDDFGAIKTNHNNRGGLMSSVKTMGMPENWVVPTGKSSSAVLGWNTPLEDSKD